MPCVTMIHGRLHLTFPPNGYSYIFQSLGIKMANLEKTWYLLLSSNFFFFCFHGGSGSLISRPEENSKASIVEY